MPERYSFEEAKRVFEANGFKVLQDFYVNIKTPLKCICPCGNITRKTLASVKIGQKCKVCGYKGRDVGKTPYEYVVKVFKDRGCELLTKEEDYRGIRLGFRYKCSCGKEGFGDFYNFMKGTRCRECVIKMNSGKYHNNYNPELTDEYRERHRLDRNLKIWRHEIKKRDNFTCQICGDNKGGNLVSHHIDGYNKHPELRYEMNNGVTLCESCHMEFHNKYGYGGNTRKQFSEFISLKGLSEQEVLPT